ncbi:phosphodiesterase 8A [Phyllostomus discolor]|uniref:Phosphodiesterase 8A n=1 Tax=Phyllostomus discolor TaxID=89673 RepID=A0A834DI32_9CHIR|nr:phosphodiesterase 8A [Phyllostomus discolor]
MARIHSMTIEAPITKVINIINAAQENSPTPVTEALDRVLEILRTTELYSPQLGVKDDDPHASDLVGGLMTVSVRAGPLPGACSCCWSHGHPLSGWAARAPRPLPSSPCRLPPATGAWGRAGRGTPSGSAELGSPFA